MQRCIALKKFTLQFTSRFYRASSHISRGETRESGRKRRDQNARVTRQLLLRLRDSLIDFLESGGVILFNNDRITDGTRRQMEAKASAAFHAKWTQSLIDRRSGINPSRIASLLRHLSLSVRVLSKRRGSEDSKSFAKYFAIIVE